MVGLKVSAEGDEDDDAVEANVSLGPGDDGERPFEAAAAAQAPAKPTSSAPAPPPRQMIFVALGRCWIRGGREEEGELVGEAVDAMADRDVDVALASLLRFRED